MTGAVARTARATRGGEDGVLVRVDTTQGSAPREAGAWMAVWADGLTATIGGGQLEFQAIDEARGWLAGGRGDRGRAALSARPQPGPVLRRRGVPVVSAHRRGRMRRRWQSELLRRTWQPVALFGGGHVGAALARLLSPLPFAVRWIDSRDEIFPDAGARASRMRALRPGAAAVRAARARLARADHELQPRRGPGHRRRLPASGCASATTCPTSA